MWGAALGAGAAFLGGFFTGGWSWTLIPVAIGGTVAGGGAEYGVKWFGSTFGGEAEKVGIPQGQQYQEWLKWREDSKKYMEEKTDEWFKEIKERNKELQEENKKFAEQIKNSNDPTEKARLMEMMSENKKEINQNNQMMAEKISKLQKVFESFGTQPLTQQQFDSKAENPDLSKYKTWGILIFFLVVGILLISFLKKLLNKALGITN